MGSCLSHTSSPGSPTLSSLCSASQPHQAGPASGPSHWLFLLPDTLVHPSLLFGFSTCFSLSSKCHLLSKDGLDHSTSMPARSPQASVPDDTPSRGGGDGIPSQPIQPCFEARHLPHWSVNSPKGSACLSSSSLCARYPAPCVGTLTATYSLSVTRMTKRMTIWRARKCNPRPM